MWRKVGGGEGRGRGGGDDKSGLNMFSGFPSLCTLSRVHWTSIAARPARLGVAATALQRVAV